jgi:hypothetical protein
MVLITRSFLALLSLTGAALGSVAKIEADLASMAKAVTTLNGAITTFPSTGGTLAQALVRFFALFFFDVGCMYNVWMMGCVVCRRSMKRRWASPGPSRRPPAMLRCVLRLVLADTLRRRYLWLTGCVMCNVCRRRRLLALRMARPF